MTDSEIIHGQFWKYTKHKSKKEKHVSSFKNICFFFSQLSELKYAKVRLFLPLQRLRHCDLRPGSTKFGSTSFLHFVCSQNFSNTFAVQNDNIEFSKGFKNWLSSWNLPREPGWQMEDISNFQVKQQLLINFLDEAVLWNVLWNVKEQRKLENVERQDKLFCKSQRRRSTKEQRCALPHLKFHDNFVLQQC